jgi:ADP-heptose:LPS heptosyltransferase
LLEALRRESPESKIVVATHGLALEVYRYSTFIDRMLPIRDPNCHPLAVANQIRQEGVFDDDDAWAMLMTQGNQRIGIAIAGMLAGCRMRVGYCVHPQLLHLPLQTDAAQTQIARNLKLLHVLGIETEAPEPIIHFSQACLASAHQLAHNFNPDGRPMCIIVTQVSGGQRTDWYTNRFAEVMDAIADRGWRILLPGTTAQVKKIETLLESVKTYTRLQSMNIAGMTDIPELSAVCCISDMAVTLDTGTLHLARAAGLPLVVLGPSWQRPHEWLPVQCENARILRGADIDFAPVGYRLDEIQPAEVIAAFDELAELYPPRSEKRKQRIRRCLSTTDHHVDYKL